MSWVTQGLSSLLDWDPTGVRGRQGEHLAGRAVGSGALRASRGRAAAAREAGGGAVCRWRGAGQVAPTCPGLCDWVRLM